MIAHYRQVLNDPLRLAAYRYAIEEVLTPGDTFLEIGCGLGTYSMLAVQAGASRVYAIDPNPIVQTARELAKTNNVHDHIDFTQTRSEDFDIPERVDWIITEFFGASAVDLFLTNTLADAASRFLKPHGRMIPCAVTIYVAPIECPKIYQDHLHQVSSHVQDLDFSSTATQMANYPLYSDLTPCRLLTPPSQIAQSQLPVEPQSSLCTQTTFPCTEAGTIHGFGIWFDLDLTPGVSLSTAPTEPSLAWQKIFLPLERPIPVKPDTRVSLDLQAHAGLNDEIWWRWEGHRRHTAKGRPAWHFHQNSFKSIPLPSRPTVGPSLDTPLEKSAVGEEMYFLLSQVNGQSTFDALAKSLQTFSPYRYPTEDKARIRLTELGELLQEASTTDSPSLRQLL